MQTTYKKRLSVFFTVIISALLISAGAIMLAPKTTANADAEETHDHSTMTEYTGELADGASYYLTDNIDGNLTVSGTVTLCLNGHTITGDGTKSVITVSGDAEFTLCDCQETGCITGGTGNYKYYFNQWENWGGGVCVEDYGTFKMLGGTISDNTASCGGGVSVCKYGTFEMSGGEISGNTADSGGGVYVLGTFEMTGGEISGNTADNGGGVCVHEYGAFEMTDGEISGNTADNGGGVYVGELFEGGEEEAESLTERNYAVSRSGGFMFEMTGGEISGNEANYDGGGVYVSSDGTFKMTGGVIGNNTANYDGGGVRAIGAFSVSGAPDITGNKKSDNSANNVCLYGSRKITVAGELTDGAKIGVYDTGAVATGYTQDDDPSNYFIPDDADYNCIYVSDKASGTVVITLHFTTGNGTVDKEPTCTEPGSESKHCTNCDKKLNPQEIPARGHTLTHHEATAATEEKDGNTEYWSCEKCGDYFSDENGETVIEDKSSIVLPKLTPAKQPTTPAQQKKSYVWICWLLFPLALAVAGITLGVWLYKKNKERE